MSATTTISLPAGRSTQGPGICPELTRSAFSSPPPGARGAPNTGQVHGPWSLRSILTAMLRSFASALFISLLLPGAAIAQDRPFIFSMATAAGPAATTPQLRVDYELGLGDRAFQQQASNGPEQRIGLHATKGRLAFIGHVGVAKETGAYQSSQQGEVLVSLFPRRGSRFALAAGGGLLHEAGGTNVLLGRLVAGHEGTATRVYGNLLMQKPFASGRDAIDVITSAGWAVRVTTSLAIGLEAIGEDIEGFWDAAEAEGGSRILVGPSLHLAPKGRTWQLSMAGGPTFHPTAVTGKTSTALRDLPATNTRDFAARMTFAVRF